MSQTDDPFEQADEADVLEQRQTLDGTGTVVEPETVDDDLDVADDEEPEDDDAYPHRLSEPPD